MLELPTTIRKAPRPAYKKSDAVKELERLANEAARKKFPSIPIECLAPRMYRDDSANALTKCITAYMTLRGAFSSRLSNTGVYDARLGQYRATTAKKGLPDVLGTYNGRSLFIEVKYGKDRMSEHQKKIESEQTASGGLYFAAHDFTTFKLWFDNL